MSGKLDGKKESMEGWAGGEKDSQVDCTGFREVVFF